MEKTIKIQWVEALRSGKYAQTKKALRDDAGFCCLGVLCDVLKDHPDVQGRWVNGGFLVNKATVPNKSYPSEIVCSLAGLEYGGDSLSIMNDGGKTFNEIADYIEGNL